MSISLIVKNGLRVSKSDINGAIAKSGNYGNATVFNKYENLYNQYYINIYDNDGNIKNTSLEYYNEIALPEFHKYLNLFIDLDVKNNELLSENLTLKKIIEDYKRVASEENKNLLDEINDEWYLLNTLIRDFADFFIKNYYNNKLKALYISDEKTFDITNTLSNKAFKKLILDNFSVTKNISSYKYSYHIYFNAIRFDITLMPHIKDIIINYIKETNHPFKEYIDTQVYKKQTSLRLPYCKKDNNKEDNNKEDNNEKSKIDNSYHRPLIIENNIVTPETEYLTKEIISNYLFTQRNPLLDKYLVIENNNNNNNDNNIDEISLDDEIIKNNYKRIYDDFKDNPDIYFMTLKRLLAHIFTEKQIILIEHLKSLKNIEKYASEKLIKDIPISEVEDYLNLVFDYELVKKCIYCKKKAHAHPHKIILERTGLLVLKNGGMQQNCSLYIKPYMQLTEQNICDFIYSRNVVKRLENDEMIIFGKKDGWIIIDETSISRLKYLITCNTNYFKTSDLIRLDNMSNIKLKDSFYSLILKDDPVKDDPYLFKFKNGVLNMKTKKFTKMEDTIDLYVFPKVDYNYTLPENYNDEQIENDKFIRKVLNDILPINDKDGKTNIHRKNFEINSSTSIIQDHGKDVITGLIGKTRAGKSTLKALLFATLGSRNIAELHTNIYCTPIDPDKPNPWLAQLAHKYISFASETTENSVFLAKNVKDLTESSIKARRLYSNISTHEIRVTHFIDSNYKIELDDNDPAGLRRILEIECKAHFKDNKMSLLSGSEDIVEHECSKGIKTLIQNGKYSLSMFNILLEWATKYDHFNGIKMVDSTHTNPICLLHHCIQNMSINGSIIKSKHLKKEVIDTYLEYDLKACNNVSYLVYGKVERVLFSAYFLKYVNYHKWDINVEKHIKPYSMKLNDEKKIIPFVILADIKPKYLSEVIKLHQERNKDFTLDYFNANRFIGDTDDYKFSLNF